MASGQSRDESSVYICHTCLALNWLLLPAENAIAMPHHSSRTALEKSAETCRLCAMVLRSAIANCEADSGDTGRWREFTNIKVHDGTKISDMLCVRDLGAHRPNYFHVSPLILDGTGHTVESAGELTKGALGQNGSGPPVLAFTHYRVDRSTKADEDLSNAVKKMTIRGDNAGNQGLPVWVYGNYWAEYDPKYPGDVSRSKELLMGIGARFGTTGSILDVANARPGQMSLRGSTIRIGIDDGKSPKFPSTVQLCQSLIEAKGHAVSAHIPGRIPETMPNSDLAQRRLAAWLQNCQSNHPQCGLQKGSAKLPTRVIDVLSHSRVVKLVEGQGNQGQYVALSHTWGKTPRLVTTRQTLEDLEMGIAVSFLPKTFQDAIQITRQLKIQYLWIDCLCIVQDPEEWEKEAAAMTEVYRNAEITISASASSDSYSGCFVDRTNTTFPSLPSRSLGIEPASDPHTPAGGFTLTVFPPRAPGKPLRIHFSEDWLPGSLTARPQDARVGAFGKDIDPIAPEPLSSRGWTLQERLLSRRIIHFASDQMYFECEAGMVSECGFKLPNSQFSMLNCVAAELSPPSTGEKGVSFVLGQHVDAGGGPRRRRGWLSLVENYSKRQLSNAEDKLTAIAGVARYLADATGDTYLGGLWRRRLLEDLFWRVQTHEEWVERVEGDGFILVAKTGALIGSVSRPAEYRAPSWSWASIDAPVKFITLSHSRLVCQPRLCFNTLSGKDPYGRLKDGIVDMDAPVFEVQSYQPPQPWDRHGTPASIDLGDERGKVYGSIFLDLPHEPLPFPCYAVFIDPAHAIIVRSKHMDTADKPKSILSTSSLPPTFRKAERGTRIIWLRPGVTEDSVVQISQENYDNLLAGMSGHVSLVSEINQVVRIGVGIFVKEHSPGSNKSGDEKPINAEEYEKKVGKELQLSDVLHVSGDESWGIVTRDDAWVPVSIR